MALNRIFGSLRAGDFGFIFARPETGKTTFLASETTYMASQLEESDGPIIWFNNEEQNEKVKIRCYQAALGATLAQINANPQAAREAYLKATKGKHLLYNSKSAITKDVVERVVKTYKPKLIVVDQIDKIQGFKAEREDLLMGSIYQWFRDLAKSEQHATIAVCQADGSGEGQKWLTMANVANAKTAKQAEADWILGIGKVNDSGFERLRYLHASKNKLAGDEDTDFNLRHGKLEVLISPAIARYEDLQK
jgi:replicative DNA helicase